MYRISDKRIDNRQHALDVMVKSGILCEIDNETAHKVIKSIVN